jgi:trk system potassium uptake protein
MFVIIIGGGRTGTYLARLLLSQNYEVRIVESRHEILARMHRELPTEIIYEGNTNDIKVLEHAGIQKADVLAAVTTNDEVNLAVCYIGRSCYNVRRTIARVNNPRNAWLFNEIFAVDVAVNPAEIISHLIEEEMSMGDMMTLLKLKRGNYSLVEEKIPEGAPGIGVAIKDLKLDGCVIAAIIRHGKVIVPRGITTFQAGDEVLAVTDTDGAHQLAAILENPNRKSSQTDNQNKRID